MNATTTHEDTSKSIRLWVLEEEGRALDLGELQAVAAAGYDVTGRVLDVLADAIRAAVAPRPAFVLRRGIDPDLDSIVERTGPLADALAFRDDVVRAAASVPRPPVVTVEVSRVVHVEVDAATVRKLGLTPNALKDNLKMTAVLVVLSAEGARERQIIVNVETPKARR